MMGLTLAGCGINSVTPEEIGAIKAGDIVTWRYSKKTDAGNSWLYCERIEKVDGDNVTFVPSIKEGTSKTMPSLREFDKEPETTTITEMKKYATEQGDDKKVIIEIESKS